MLFSAVALAAGACRTAPPKSYVNVEWDELERLNPTDVAVTAIPQGVLPKELSPNILREAARDALLAHRYSPLAFDYIDAAGTLRNGGSSRGSAENASAAPAPPPVVRLDIVVSSFEAASYSITQKIRVQGKLLFTNTQSDQTLAAIASDQTIDLDRESRHNLPLAEVYRAAARAFVTNALEAMPTRRIEVPK